MKYKILGFNQLEAIRLGLNIKDLLVLKWFLEFKQIPKIERNYIEKINDMGYWVNYSTLIEQIPLLLPDGQTYLNELIELKKKKNTLSEKEYKDLEKQIMMKRRKVVQRLFDGNLKKVLIRDVNTLGHKQGKKVYLYLDAEVLSRLTCDKNNIDTYVDNMLISSSENVDKVECDGKNLKQEDKNVPYTWDKNVSYTWDKNVSYTWDKNVPSDTVSNDTVYTDSVYTDTVTHPVIEKIKLIKNETNLDIDSKNKLITISKWDMDRLIKAIAIYKSKGGQYFKLLKQIYDADKNFIPSKEKNSKIITPIKTKFHNFEETFLKYTPEELDKIIEASQKEKFK